MPETETVLVEARRLRGFCVQVFETLGLPSEDAAIISNVLVETDLRGVDSHGVALLRPYVGALQQTGEINPRPVITTVRDKPALTLLDGDRGMGHVVAVRAMQRCLEKARLTGMAAVGVRNSCHFGMAAYYAMMALPHDMIGFCTTNTEPIMTAYGGVDAVLGNNPQAYAIPAGEEFPIVIDLAHSVVAAGKVGLAARSGEPVPEGWVIDEQGDAITDPNRALADLRLVPMGGAKGYGLGVVMEALAGVLTGAQFGRAFNDSGRTVDQEIGHFFWALDVAALVEPAEFKSRIDDLIRQIKASRPAPGVARVFAPGERGFLQHEQRSKAGIPLHASVWRDLELVADDLGLAVQLSDTRVSGR